MLVPSSQAVSSASNFVMAAFAIVSFEHSDFLKWCIFSVSTLALQGCLRNIFLESEFAIYGTVRKRNLQICICTSFLFVIFLVFVSNTILNSDFSDVDLFLALYSFSLLLEDFYRYKFLKIKPKVTLLVDVAILIAACILLIGYFTWLDFTIVQALSIMIGVQFTSFAIFLFSTHEKFIESAERRDYYRESFLSIQSLTNLVSMVGANFLLVKFLSIDQLRDFRLIQLSISPLQSLSLILWLWSLAGFQESSLERLRSVFFTRLKNGTVITTLTLVPILLFVSYSDLQHEQLIAFLLAFYIVLTNAVCMPLNLMLRKLESYKSIAFLSAGLGLLTPLLYFLLRENLGLIEIFAVPLVLQIILFICFFRIILVLTNVREKSVV
jgi:hypothetical protein